MVEELAAEAVLGARRYRREDLEPYASSLRARMGPRPRTSRLATLGRPFGGGFALEFMVHAPHSPRPRVPPAPATGAVESLRDFGIWTSPPRDEPRKARAAPPSKSGLASALLLLWGEGFR